ncbi:ABC transporter ATP-binding protein [Desulfosporosinus meridiei]|uniref:ATPase component of various ABC-type transport systems with duplicated ATPase domain n=1 Tax=Desulfosporosinus meridiei (strain ATCC BAA-275 / DSM 13257 / KCTC 12902 / NCIMB 13706 / S10) TaxID=768704 RepID=J7IVD5_DESMD|nr:energy-coupling factor transporter ATPase [Desulfosporosinus meridiei]AFQ44119.1 ATPase component of various ABC-type transport systems with duplicated ATPase domain [Desulfosporosinus meridiei DSM 13257]
MIELKDLSYTYPNASEPSLRNINLSVEKGKFVALLGSTGAGKTTLSLCLNGLIPQLLEGKLSGRVRIAGKDVGKTAVQTLAKVLGLVLQDPETQIIGRSVEEDTAFGPRNFLVPATEIEQRVDQALATVRLTGYNHRLTEELSGGEKQRLAIAGVLAMEPEILVLDEPTSELDPLGRSEIYDTLTALRRKKNLTILLVDHSTEELMDKVDEVVVLNQGELVWRGVPSDLFRNLPLLRRWGIKPLPVSEIGWEFYERGWISLAEIPLDIPAAEGLIRKLLPTYGARPRHPLEREKYLGKSQHQSQQNGETSLSMRKPNLSEKVLAVEIKDLTYQYNSGSPALRGINLTVKSGEFLALIGQNGAGKTTLAKHFNGLLQPTGGEVIIEGMNTLRVDTSELAKIVGYVFQNPDHQIFSATVEKELEFGLKNAGYRGSEIKKRVTEVLEYTGLEPYRSVHPFSLGKGERQMIAVASILVLKPKLLIIDEPTTGSDWSGVQKMMALIQKLHSAGTTIIMISHDMDLVAQYAKRVIVMKDGEISLDGTPQEIFSDEEVLRESFLAAPQLCKLSLQLKDVLGPQIFVEASEFIGLFESGEQRGC